MRTRGCYRVTNGLVTIKSKANSNVNQNEEVIDISEEQVVKRPKCQQNKDIGKTCAVIVIESDDDNNEDIEMIESEADSSISLSETESELLIVEAPLKRCFQCFKQLPTNLNKAKEDYEYNRLTSADFYNNPRIHPSVISIELKDRIRINCFEESISRNQELFVDKTVLIIGSGTGLLALFAAKAGAKNVIIYDCSGILQIIEAVIEKNRWRLPNRKTNFYLIRRSIDDYILPNGLKKVDIIVSDWPNHSLFYKSMALTFIKARNKWLKKGGLIFPDMARLYIAGAHDYIHRHDRKDKRSSQSIYVKRIDYWDHNVYGFDMTSIRSKVLSEPLHEYVLKSQVITNEYHIKTYNLYEVSAEDINFCLPFQLNAIKNHYLQTFVLFFDVIFNKNPTVPLMYSTRPTAYKHMFRPTVLFIESSKQLTVEKEDKINGVFKYSLSEDLTQISFEIKFQFKNKYFDVTEELMYSTK